MTKEREQSAIDAIYELLEEVKEMRNELKVVDSNIKLLNNKISKLSVVSAAPPPVKPAITATAVPVTSKEAVAVNSTNGNHTIKMFERVKNQARKPIKGVYIRVYDPSGTVVKSRETDTEGYWEARVLPGKYVVELDASHINKNFLPKNMNVEINDSMNEFEVK